MAQLILGLIIFVIVFVLKLIFGAAGGALQAVESVRRDNDFERYVGGSHRDSGQYLLSKKSGAQIIREYEELYEDGIISHEEYQQVKRNAINGTLI